LHLFPNIDPPAGFHLVQQVPAVVVESLLHPMYVEVTLPNTLQLAYRDRLQASLERLSIRSVLALTQEQILP
jgi:hypothetical protein